MARRVARLGSAAALVLVLAAGGVLAWGYASFVRPGPLAAPATAVIPRGAGLEAISELLAKKGVIARPLVFRAGAWFDGAERSLRAGEYAFAPGTSARAVVALIRSGKTVVRRLTVPEGLTVAQVLRQLEATEGLEGKPAHVPEEGTLLPETYNFGYGDSRAAMVQRMSEAMEKLLDQRWERRHAGLPLKTPREALILASIVEKETALVDERPRIAAVFVNRLRKAMRLQSDPTVVYALTQGQGPLGRALTRADLQADSPFNTYLRPGLPPAPIANPGRESLEAVLFPPETDELYFVADGSGGHVFSGSLEEHNRNVQRWRRIREP